ncbi:MAG: hypothetical protein KF901_08670 [Myxococcales bacterium]|nr:hypothetical protein [Myxococcales bacterium]
MRPPAHVRTRAPFAWVAAWVAVAWLAFPAAAQRSDIVRAGGERDAIVGPATLADARASASDVGAGAGEAARRVVPTGVSGVEPVPTVHDRPDAPGPSDRIGPFEIEGRHGRLGIGLGIHLRSTVDHDAQGTRSSLDLQRMRFFLRGAMLEERLRFNIHLNLTPKFTELVDVSIDGRLHPAVAVRVGAHKIPFTSYWWLSFPQFQLVDWPTTIAYFGGGRQVGVTVFDPREGPGVHYAIGVYQGQSLRPRNGAFFTTVYGDRPTNHLDLRRYAPLAEPHPEIVGRLSWSTETVLISASAAWDLRPVHGVDETLRFAIDARVQRGPMTLWAAGYLSASERRDGKLDLALGGSMVELGVWAHRRLLLAARHAVVVRTQALRRDARETAAERVLADPSLADQYANVGGVRVEHESMLGVTVPLYGASLRFQSDVSWLRTRGDVDTDALRVRGQLLLAF